MGNHEKHSFKMVQNRDKIKIHEIEKFGYIPYVIKDMGKEKDFRPMDRNSCRTWGYLFWVW